MPLNLFQLEMNPFEYKSNIPELPEGKRLMLVEKYQMSLEIAIQLVVIKHVHEHKFAKFNFPYTAINRMGAIQATSKLS